MKIRRKLRFLLCQYFGKINKINYSLGKSIMHTFVYAKLPWHPYTGTDTYFSEEMVNITSDGKIELSVKKSMLPDIVGDNELILHYRGGCLTTVNSTFKFGTYTYGRFDYKIRMSTNPNVVCAVWWLTKTQLKDFKDGKMESILPEVDWPEYGVDNDRDRINLAIQDGVLYRQPGWSLASAKFSPKGMTSGHYWMDWKPNKLTFGFENHVVAEYTENVPTEPLYPIIWIAVAKWGSLPDDVVEKFYIDEFTYHR